MANGELSDQLEHETEEEHPLIENMVTEEAPSQAAPTAPQAQSMLSQLTAQLESEKDVRMAEEPTKPLEGE